jgi:hypothetical protein
MVEGRSISVNLQKGLQKGLGAVLAVGLALGTASCGTFSHYPQGMEQTTLAPLRTGQNPNYQKTFRRRTTKKIAGTLFALEMGRTAQLAGDFEASRAAFETAFAGIEDLDNRAVVSARGAVAQGSAVLVNDKAIPYRTPSYERTLAHHYQALNYLALGDLTGAGVEVRRANREQEEALRRREKEVAKAKSKESNAPADDERDPHLGAVYAGLDQLAGSVKSSFQNAATFYVSAVIWEMLGEQNDAYIDVKKALEIAPENHFLQLDAVRLAKRLGMREDLEDYERRFPRAAKMPAAGSGKLADKARLVVVYEEGLVPPKVELEVPYPLTSTDSIGLVALPTYAAAPPPPAPVRVALDGQSLASTAPICNVGALAARALAEQMPGILTRQLARAIAKGAASKAAHDAGGSAGQLAELAVLLYNVASEQADLRSWLTLPAHVQIFSTYVDAGDRSVALAGPGAGTAWTGPVTLRAGKTTLIHVTRIDLAVYSHVFVQP